MTKKRLRSSRKVMLSRRRKYQPTKTRVWGTRKHRLRAMLLGGAK